MGSPAAAATLRPGSAPTSWPSALRSAISGGELSTGSAQDSYPCPRQVSPLTASPLWRPNPPPKALSILTGFCLDSKQASPHRRPQPAAPGSRSFKPGPLPARATRKPAGPAPRFCPPGGPGATPQAEASPVSRPLCSGLLRPLTLKVGLEVTFAEGAEVAMQRSQIPGGGRGRHQPQQPEERAPGPAAETRSRHADEAGARRGPTAPP